MKGRVVFHVLIQLRLSCFILSFSSCQNLLAAILANHLAKKVLDIYYGETLALPRREIAPLVGLFQELSEIFSNVFQ